MARNSHRPGSKHPAKRRSRRAVALLAALKRWKNKTSLVSSAEKDWFKSLENLSGDLTKISKHSSTCTGVCNMVQEVRRKGLASVLLVQCDKYNEKFYLESSRKSER